MAAHSLIYTICFLLLCFFVRPSTSVVYIRVAESFIAKHVMVSDKVVCNIPIDFIVEKFNNVQEYAYFINEIDLAENIRSIHTFIVTKNLNLFEIDLAEVYFRKFNKYVYQYNLVPIDSHELGHIVGVINFKITFNLTERKYKVLKYTCNCSDQGTLRLGSRWTAINRRAINHLTGVMLPENAETCKMPPDRIRSLPPRACENKKRRNKSTP